MLEWLKKRDNEFFQGYLLGNKKKLPFHYAEIDGSYALDGAIMEGVGVNTASLTIKTSDCELPFTIGREVEIEDGAKLKISGIKPMKNARAAIYGRVTTIAYLLVLE